MVTASSSELAGTTPTWANAPDEDVAADHGTEAAEERGLTGVDASQETKVQAIA
jgi:hypothetical protein